MQTYLLELSEVVVEIGSMRIVDAVSLKVQQGEALGIIGPNGSGKTTLFNAINGFLPIREGKLFLSGKNVTSFSAHERACMGIARVFQNSGIFRDMTLEENMVIALETREKQYYPLFPWSAKYKKNLEIARKLLEDVKLADKMKHKAASLSGGQMRLLEICRALAFGAELFLLDEPTAGVSPRMKDEVVAFITRLKQLGKTVMIIEHDITLIQRFCERIVVLDAGKVVMDGSPAVVRESPALQQIYFGASIS